MIKVTLRPLSGSSGRSPSKDMPARKPPLAQCTKRAQEFPKITERQ